MSTTHYAVILQRFVRSFERDEKPVVLQTYVSCARAHRRVNEEKFYMVCQELHVVCIEQEQFRRYFRDYENAVLNTGLILQDLHSLFGQLIKENRAHRVRVWVQSVTVDTKGDDDDDDDDGDDDDDE